MKFQLTFKTPDVWDQCEECDEEAKEVFSKFVQYDELITIEFDTETQTARVVPRR